MDYVVAGLAAGAGLAIFGFLLREAGLSKRLTLPLWLADAGLALMATAVVTWLLTFTAITTELDDGEAATIIGAGSIVALIAAAALVIHSGSRRRAMMRTRMPAPKVQTGYEPIIATTPPPVVSTEPPAVEPALVESANRTQQDWEEIWRATWGSGELPRAAEVAVEQTPNTAPESNPSWENWSADEDADGPELSTTENAATEQSVDESPAAQSKDLESPATNPNGAPPVPRPVEERD